MQRFLSILWFCLGLTSSFALLVYLYHSLSHKPTSSNVLVCLGAGFTLGFWVGMLLGRIVRLGWFTVGALAAGAMILFPFVVVSYGYALYLFPLVPLWASTVWIGLSTGRWVFLRLKNAGGE